MSEMIATLNAIGARRAELTKQLEQEAVAILRPLLEGFLKDHPSIEALKWKQYTPYFNDGDECTFHVRELHVRMVGSPDDIGDYGDGYVSLPGSSSTYFDGSDFAELGGTRQLAGLLNDLESALHSNEEACLAAFGDHVEVTVTRDGIEVDEYDHD
jgi:hypothetical protein